MNDTANTAYTFGMATGEILALLLLSFLIGMLLCWILQEIGICCRSRQKPLLTASNPVSTIKFSAPEAKLHITPSSPTLPSAKLHLPETDLPKADLHLPKVSLPEVELHQPAVSLALLDIDPHKPIIDPPDMDLGMALPDVETPSATTNLFGDWLHKAKDSVEHLAEKASPSATDWLHKAKDSVEHLAEKASPSAQDWLHKAKEIGSDLSSKGSALTATAGGITLAGLAAGAKGLTERITSNLHLKQDDLCKLEGIGTTFEVVLNRAGIYTYQQLADTTAEHLSGVLDAEDAQFRTHDPSSWPQQAALAATGEWEKLKEYQATL